MSEPLPTDPGYAWWDPTLSLKDTLHALNVSLDDLEHENSKQALLMGNVIQEFRSNIARLSARCDRIEAILIDQGRLTPSKPSQVTSLSDFLDEEVQA